MIKGIYWGEIADNENPAYLDQIDALEDYCRRCGDMVPELEISPETDNECLKCQKVERCICDEPINECKHCNKSGFDRFRDWVIDFIHNLY